MLFNTKFAQLFSNAPAVVATTIVLACTTQVFAAGNVIPPITNADGDVYSYSYKGPQSDVPVVKDHASASADTLPDRAPYEPGSRKSEIKPPVSEERSDFAAPKPKSTPTPTQPAPTRRVRTVDGIPLPADAVEEGEGRTTATVTVAIRTKLNKRAVDHIGIYPSPQMPPRIKQEISPLGEDTRTLKSMLLQSGYQDRLSLDHPYPAYGYRWHTAYQNALQKGGMGVPHTMFDYYPWIDRMVQHIRPEVIKINKHEKARKEAYLKCVTFFQDESRDAESDAVRNNLYPLTFEIHKDSTGSYGRGEVAAGNWWITATRKLPGLQLYWQVPIQLTGGQTPQVVLNEDNALWIQGGW